MPRLAANFFRFLVALCKLHDNRLKTGFPPKRVWKMWKTPQNVEKCGKYWGVEGAVFHIFHI